MDFYISCAELMQCILQAYEGNTDKISISTLIISFIRPDFTASSVSTHCFTAFFSTEVLKWDACATYFPAAKGGTPILEAMVLLS